MFQWKTFAFQEKHFQFPRAKFKKQKVRNSTITELLLISYKVEMSLRTKKHSNGTIPVKKDWPLTYWSHVQNDTKYHIINKTKTFVSRYSLHNAVPIHCLTMHDKPVFNINTMLDALIALMLNSQTNVAWCAFMHAYVSMWISNAWIIQVNKL